MQEVYYISHAGTDSDRLAIYSEKTGKRLAVIFGYIVPSRDENIARIGSRKLEVGTSDSETTVTYDGLPYLSIDRVVQSVSTSKGKYSLLGEEGKLVINLYECVSSGFGPALGPKVNDMSSRFGELILDDILLPEDEILKIMTAIYICYAGAADPITESSILIQKTMRKLAAFKSKFY